MEPCEQLIVSLSNPSHLSMLLTTVPENICSITVADHISLISYYQPCFLIIMDAALQPPILLLPLDCTIIAVQYSSSIPSVQLCASRLLLPCVCQHLLLRSSYSSIILLFTGYRLYFLLETVLSNSPPAVPRKGRDERDESHAGC